MTTDERLRAAWAALDTGRPDEALQLLEGLAVPGRPAAEARAAAWRAQALDRLGRLPEAERAAAGAVRLAKAAGDADGVVTTRALHQRIVASLAAAQLADRARAADAVLADSPVDLGAPDAAALLVRRANVLCDLGRFEEARADAAVALTRAHGSPRDEILALLTLARATPGDAASHIHAAHALADAADDMNLLTAVARAASAAGVRLTAPGF